MSRPRNAVPAQLLKLSLPLDVRVALDLHLFNELEGRVPLGAYQKFFASRIKEFLVWKTLDLHPYGYPPGYFVKGPEEVLKQLQLHLEG